MLIQLPLSQCLKIITLHYFKESEYYFLHTWHMEHSQARWHGCVCHGHPTPGKDFTPGLPNLRPKYYPSPCHQQETTFAKLRHRSQIRAASILLLFGQGGTELHDRKTCKYLSLLISSTTGLLRVPCPWPSSGTDTWTGVCPCALNDVMLC